MGSLRVMTFRGGGSGWAGENRSLFSPRAILHGGSFPNSDFSYSVRSSMDGERYRRLDEVITNGLASSPHDWLKVENESKIQPR